MVSFYRGFRFRRVLRVNSTFRRGFLMSRTILVVEDEKDLARLLGIHLRDLGADVEIAGDGESGLTAALSRTWDLVILDIMLPGMDGLELCRRIRSREEYTPILMLTARGTELDRVLGLELGADDYVTKPFSIRELMARVKAIFRRVDAMKSAGSDTPPEPLRSGDLVIDREKRAVRLKGRDIALTAKEYDLLEQLARTPGRVYPRAQLLEMVWGYTYDGYEHTLVSHINRLRRKIEENPSRPRYVITVRGVGYKFADDDDREGR
jgi:DNA-binding response OmpR family regulator